MGDGVKGALRSLKVENSNRYFPSREPAVLEIGAGGAGRDRTDDLLNAIQALSQLSYSPF